MLIRNTFVFFQRWDTYLLTRREPRIRLYSRAVDAHLSRAQEFLQMPERQRRIMRLEPTVEAHVGFIDGNGAGLDRHELLDPRG